MDPQPTRSLHYHIATSFVLLVLAVAGWVGFAYAARNSTELQKRSVERIDALTAERDRLEVERNQWRRAHDTLHDVEKGFMAARQTYAVSQATLTGELNAAREQLRQLSAQKDGYVVQLDAMRGEVARLKRQLEQFSRDSVAEEAPTPQRSKKRTASAKPD